MKKERKRRLFAATACAAALAVAAVSGTLAFLQDEDSDVNVMTLGNVKIEQHEYQRADGVPYNAVASKENETLVPFEQGQLLMPAVPANGAATDYTAEATDLFKWGNYVHTGTAANGLWNDGKLKNQMDKMIFIENTGKSDAWVRTVIAFECPEGMEYSQGPDKQFMMNVNGSDLYDWEFIGYATINGTRYLLETATYQTALKPGQTSHPSLLQVVMTHNVENEDVAKLGNTYGILAVSQAVQTEGFADAETALNAGFGDITTTNHPWVDGVEIPTAVATADELAKALTNGESVYLTEDVALDSNATLTIERGVESTLNLNGHTLSGENSRTATHNFLIDVKGGTLSIANGTVSIKHVGNNMGWNGATTVIDVTAGGVLNLEGVTVKNEGGTDMNFGVHLNNWGEVTLNADDCVFDAPYCGVRVFNSGYDMNNVTITDSTLKGATRAFWVHNYIGDLNSTQHPDEAIKARLNLDIYGNNNKFEITGTATSPIRYGFGTTVYYDVNGNEIVTD